MSYHYLKTLITMGRFTVDNYEKVDHSQIKEGKVDVTEAVMKRCEIPSNLWNVTIDNIDSDSDIYQDIDKYLRNIWTAYEKGIGFVFLGPSQSGKSALASIILKYARSLGFKCLFQNSNDLVSRIIQSEDYDDVQSYESRCLNVDFLTIDHVEPSTNENRFSIINRIIRKRHSWKKPTIITSCIPEEYMYQFFPPDFKKIVSSRFRVKSLTDSQWVERMKKEKEKFFGDDS